MNESFTSRTDHAVVEEDLQLTLVELSRACRAPEAQIHVWVVEGVLAPSGRQPHEWRFAGASLRRARLAWRLTQDLEVNAPGVALALDLLDEIATLRAGLRRRGGA
jgi:chaperone modulatory protein CbpM